jgi:hypothetical protein
MILYHTAACHLCEEAESLILRCLPPAALEKADIAEDPQLLARYGVHIPVLRDPLSGRELRWPFGLEDVRQLIDAGGKTGS